ncbi:MAG: methyltransferase domain-containing protein [Deltaproteobacteria bacterium]|nr:methyltransferase domain-containing protein [Deltaproteobacteria bacterium]
MNTNCYADPMRAAAYARLQFPGTYLLAFRDMAAIIAQHVSGLDALDFGCGAGRSTRFLRNLGFSTLGIDNAPEMIAQARELDPQGEYRLVDGDDLSGIARSAYDLVLAAFPFDNIPTAHRKRMLLEQLRDRLRPGGRIINLVSRPAIYVNEWASFTTKDFPENQQARSGDRVRIVMKDVDDPRPVEDVLWSDDDYRRVYQSAGLEPVAVSCPLASGQEPVRWVSETRIAPWCIYVLGTSAR